MNHPILISPRGWCDLADAEAFYPDDLPPDWRLTYFANLFPAALLPYTDWAAADAATLSDWAHEVNARFRFVLEAPPASAAADPGAAEQRLGAVLAGWVGGVPAPAPAARLPAAVRGWRGAGTMSTAEGYAVTAPAALHDDLRAARRWLQGLERGAGAAPRLIVLERPRSSTLEAWLTLIALLGRGA